MTVSRAAGAGSQYRQRNPVGPRLPLDRPIPPARDRLAAVRTPAVLDPVRKHAEAEPFDECRRAAGAAGVLPVPDPSGSVARVDEPQPLGGPDLARPNERRG